MKTLLFVVLASLPQVSIAGIYGNDDRVPMPASAPFNAIGELRRDGFPVPCTATLVSACHVVTAAHCVFKGGVPGKNIRFRPAVKDSSYEAFANDLVFGGYENLGKNRDRDWAVLRLEGLHEVGGWMKVADRKGGALMGARLSLPGYNSDLYPDASTPVATLDPNVTMVKTQASNFSSEENVLRYRADASPGSSGAPLIETDAQGNSWLVGINNAGSQHPQDQGLSRYSDRENFYLGTGVATNEFYETLQNFMAAKPCQP
jgi:V8-like Glu-specific endopeptidase